MRWKPTGIDNGKITQPWHVQNGIAADSQINLLDKQHRSFNAPEGQPHYRLAGGQLNFIDKADIVKAGGKAGLGYLYAERTIDPSDWFFQFHFHQDPVMPGSLGLKPLSSWCKPMRLTKTLVRALKVQNSGRFIGYQMEVSRPN